MRKYEPVTAVASEHTAGSIDHVPTSGPSVTSSDGASEEGASVAGAESAALELESELSLPQALSPAMSAMLPASAPTHDVRVVVMILLVLR
jgi:hypothetical protein